MGDGINQYVHRLSDLGSDIVAGCDQVSILTLFQTRQQSEFPLRSFRIWGTSDQKDPLELIGGSQISRKGFEGLANVSAIKGGDLLELIASRFAEGLFKGSRKSTVCPRV